VIVLLTGATGFIGRVLAKRLRAEGHTLRVLARSAAPAASGTMTVDLRQPLPAALPLSGVHTVFHLAGIAHRHADAALYEQVNHRATLELARRARAAGVQRFIYLSSVKAMGAPAGAEPRAEEDCTPPVDAYGASKWRAECGLRQLAAEGGMQIGILRPALVYGPGARANLGLLQRWAQLRLPPPPPGGPRSMVGRDDLVELLLSLPQLPLPPLVTWIVTDGQVYCARALCRALAAQSGRRPLLPTPPAPLWRGLSSVADLALRLPRGSTAARLFGAECYSNARLLGQTPWRPRQTFYSALAEPA
jgi:UDP-glucose 4-epimerase